jgi:hypothetical protein
VHLGRLLAAPPEQFLLFFLVAKFFFFKVGKKCDFFGFLVPKSGTIFFFTTKSPDFSIGFYHVANKCEGSLNCLLSYPILQSNLAKLRYG